MKNKKIKEPKFDLLWKNKNNNEINYKLISTRIVKLKNNYYRVDGEFKKTFWFNEWMTLGENNYDAEVKFSTEEKAKKVSDVWLKWAEELIEENLRVDTIVDTDEIKTIKTHPQHFI